MNPDSDLKHSVSFLIILSFALLLHYPIFKTEGFTPRNDWKPLIPTIDRPLHPQVEANIEDFGVLNLKWEWSLGRFYPVLNTIQVLEAFVFKKSPKLWHIETLIIGITTSLLFYIILIRLGFTFITSTLSSLWFLSRGTDLWSEKQFQEEPGMLFVMLAILFFIIGAKKARGSKYDWIAVVFLALAGLTKETFVFLFPAILLFRVFLSSYLFDRKPVFEVIREHRMIISAVGVMFLLQLFISYYAYSHGPYTQEVIGNLFSVSVPKVASMITEASRYLSYFVPSLGMIILVPIALRNRSEIKRYLFILIILGLLVLPQIFVFKNIGFITHYIYPAIIGFILLNAIGLEALWQKGTKPARVFFIILSLFSILTIISSFPATRNFTEEKIAVANTYASAAKQAIDSAGEKSAILMVCDRPWWGLGISMLVDLSKENLDCPVYFDYPEYNPKADNYASTTNLGVKLLSRYLLRLNPQDTTEIDIIFSTYPTEKSIQIIQDHYDWFNRNDWKIYKCKNYYYNYQIRSFNFVQYRKKENFIEYTVFVRNDRL